MKRVVLLITMTVGFLFANAQKIEKPKIDSSKQPQKMFYTIWPEKTWLELLELIKTADEKPSKIKAWNDLIVQSARLLADTAKQKK